MVRSTSQITITFPVRIENRVPWCHLKNAAPHLCSAIFGVLNHFLDYLCGLQLQLLLLVWGCIPNYQIVSNNIHMNRLHFEYFIVLTFACVVNILWRWWSLVLQISATVAFWLVFFSVKLFDIWELRISVNVLRGRGPKGQTFLFLLHHQRVSTKAAFLNWLRILLLI